MQLDQGCLGEVVFLDLKKAFDTVNHQILLRKLKSIGLSDLCVDWSASYLFERKQLVSIDGVDSGLQSVQHGVPQGSILGQLLFLIFINDLCDYVELCGASMHADDTAIYYMPNNVDDLRLSMQHDLQSVSYWMHENRLNLSVKKLKFILIRSKIRLQRAPAIGLNLNGQIVNCVDEFKYLGMHFDKHLQFHSHVDKVVDQATNKLSLLYKIRWLFDQQTALTLYKSLIVPHFDFGSIIYEVALQYQLCRPQVVQNSAARLILVTEPTCPVYQLHEWLGLDTLANVW